MDKYIPGIHHVTAITGDAQRNMDFYTKILGLRLVKLTVNFDDPSAYHLYFGDSAGHPGTILTFFSWPGAHTGRRGTGQITTIAFSIPDGAMGYWTQRFRDHRVAHEKPELRFGQEYLTFFDPDGLQLELVSSVGSQDVTPWNDATVPVESAIHGFHSVTLTEEGYARTASMLTETLGFRMVAESGNRYRYETGVGGPGAVVDVLCSPDARPGIVAVGTVHHVAWRTPDDDQQKAWREAISAAGLNVTPVINRRYFHSIYFREPGGVLFEIATDPPGFALDEPMERLGTRLQLPPWLEPARREIESALPPVRLPQLSYR